MRETHTQVGELARLARLALTPQEEGELEGRLEQMVGYLQALSQVEEQGDQTVPTPASFRPDGAGPSLDREKLLAQAPRVRDGYVVTPRSVGEEGAE